MKRILKTLLAVIGSCTPEYLLAQEPPDKSYTLQVEAHNFRNAEGVAQFALYNEDGTIPDENLKKYYKKEEGQIRDGKSSVIFKDLPKGRYAVTILHDENSNGKIDKILFLPKEGFGISNFNKISLSNQPDFSKASFELADDTIKIIKLIYK